MALIGGALYICGAIFVVASLQLPHPAAANAPLLYGVAGLGALCGAALIVWAKHFRMFWLHAALAAGTALICVCVYASGTATGVYSTMFVWVVVFSASFFPGRATAAHIGWLLLAYGTTLLLLADSAGFSPLTRWLLTAFALGIAGAVTSWLLIGRLAAERDLRREIEVRERLQRELEHLAHHDPLTGLANRRRFEQELNREMARGARGGGPLCLVALDLDGFKAVNDELGHAAGDRLLKASASAWETALRGSDLLARLGGDEFVALLPDCPIDEAERVADRLRQAVPLGQTCSVGIACWDREESAGDLLIRAAHAMYETRRGQAFR
jgi:diguanylate cyclase (GGDEF)-like protein